MPTENQNSHGNNYVQITIDNQPYEMHRGRQSVADIKAFAKIPPADILNQVIDEDLKPLPDDGAVTLKGGEIFISQPRDSASA